MNQLHITNARRQPFIGPRPLIKDRHIFAFMAVLPAAFAVAWLICWVCMELKNLN